MDNRKSARQSFLGPNAQSIIEQCVVGIVGLGGGGSHVVQQLAHVGFRNYFLLDPDVAEDVNLNRLIGATRDDVRLKQAKVEIAKRVVLGLEPTASIQAHQTRWQDQADLLKTCDIIFGCLDTFSERQQLETHARRYLIPYIDMGMDVHPLPDGGFAMAGQVILSMPGRPCMSCLGFLSQEKLAREASQYGSAGPSPQVVWSNGILASAAVGVAVDLLTDWSGSLRGGVYISYDGNRNLLTSHPRAQYAPLECSHFKLWNVGPPQLEGAT